MSLLLIFNKYSKTKNQGSPTNGEKAKKYQKGSVLPNTFSENLSAVCLPKK
jgi:hypothetical protein